MTWRKLKGVLSSPLFGTVVIPADARVDPTHFPEAEFPVHCPKCDYLLRGLSQQRCPECGQPFDRGRLLVQQYVQRQWQTRQGRRLVVLCALIVALVVFKHAGFFVWTALGGPIASFDLCVRAAHYFDMLLPGVLCTVVMVDLRRWLRLSARRQASRAFRWPSSRRRRPDCTR